MMDANKLNATATEMFYVNCKENTYDCYVLKVYLDKVRKIADVKPQ